MKRNEAIRRADSAARLNPDNTYFANINAAAPLWWLDIPLARISARENKEINLLLFDDRSDELHHLRIPTEYLRANKDRLDIKVVTGRRPNAERRKCISLELATDDPKPFQNIRPADSEVQFAQFKVRSIVGAGRGIVS